MGMPAPSAPVYLGVLMGAAHRTVGRCCAPGCGDSIKQGTEYALLTAPNGEQVLCESGCLQWFEHGHPDYGHPRGRIEWVGRAMLGRGTP